MLVFRMREDYKKFEEQLLWILENLFPKLMERAKKYKLELYRLNKNSKEVNK